MYYVLFNYVLEINNLGFLVFQAITFLLYKQRRLQKAVTSP